MCTCPSHTHQLSLLSVENSAFYLFCFSETFTDLHVMVCVFYQFFREKERRERSHEYDRIERGVNPSSFFFTFKQRLIKEMGAKMTMEDRQNMAGFSKAFLALRGWIKVQRKTYIFDSVGKIKRKQPWENIMFFKKFIHIHIYTHTYVDIKLWLICIVDGKNMIFRIKKF